MPGLNAPSSHESDYTEGNGQHRYTYKSIKGNFTKEAYLVQDEPRHIR
jgi:hypothetical protein